MNSPDSFNDHILHVSSFMDLVATPFTKDVNAICWKRNLQGDFAEIVEKLPLNGNITAIEPEDLHRLALGEQGRLACNILLDDLEALKIQGASPILNIIRCYDRDDTVPFFPTDVYSFHVDRSPLATATFLCTYHGDPSEILPNEQAKQKVLIPEIRAEVKKLYEGPDDAFESFLSEHFFDLHYQAEPGASPVSLGNGHVWKLAVDHPGSITIPCIHRAPTETSGQKRLLLIC